MTGYVGSEGMWAAMTWDEGRDEQGWWGGVGQSGVTWGEGGGHSGLCGVREEMSQGYVW